MSNTYWRDLDIRPAPAGWRAWFRQDHEEGSTWSTSLVGWLVQEETPSLEDYADTDTEAGDRRRRVMPVCYCDTPPYLDALDADASLWMILGPGDPDPTADERAAAIVQFRAERTEAREREAKRAADAAPAILAALERLRRPADISTIAYTARKGEGLAFHALSLLRAQGHVRRTEDRDTWEAVAVPSVPTS